ncbi:MAG: 2Fe-2S iron-sulfur cluster-binding protein, partial [Chitinispirillia bacterium]
MSLFTVSFQPQNTQVTVAKGETLLEAALKAKILLNNLCGGYGICGRCKMIVTSGRISCGISDKLTREEIQKGFVLACIAVVESDLSVTIPKETLAGKKQIADGDADRFRDIEFIFDTGGWETSPLVRKVYLKLEKPSLASNISDHQRMCAAIKKT